MKVKLADIKRVLKDAGISASFNLYAGEPNAYYHSVYVGKNEGQKVIDVLNNAGFNAMFVPACSNIYGDVLQVER